jgi:D-alanine-D-alanine ligase
MRTLHVAVIRGGPSNEYDISLDSGANVLKFLPEHYQPHDIYISKDGVWHRSGLERSPDRALAGIDVVVNALHGSYGEDGKIQKTLDQLGIPYTGSGAIASALGMNKALTKRALAEHGIKTPYFTVIRKADDLVQKEDYIYHHFFLPLVVKPTSSGSSIGVTIVKDFRDLIEALQKALSFSDSAIVEEFIRGREATCGVIDNYRDQKIYSLLPIEIVSSKDHDHYSTEAKLKGLAREDSPGHFTEVEKEEIQRLATKIHQALGFRHYSRSDFIVSPRRGIYTLEVNSLPNLSPGSLMGKSLESVGSNLIDFLDHIIKLALEDEKLF